MMNAVAKWSPVLQISNIPNEYWGMIAEYCESEYIRENDHTVNLLPMRLKILSKIDLSKVTIIKDETEDSVFKEHCITIRMSHDEMIDLKLGMGIDVLDRMHHLLIEEQSNLFNKVINERMGIIIKDVCLEIEPDIENNLIRMKSNFLSIADYRQYKIKKLKSIINERN